MLSLGQLRYSAYLDLLIAIVFELGICIHLTFFLTDALNIKFRGDMLEKITEKQRVV